MKPKQSEEIFVGPMSPLRNLFLENVKLLGSLRSVSTIRDKVLELIFLITPAERAAIFVDHTLTARARENRESVSINGEIVDRVLKGGAGVFVNERPMSMLCLPMDTLEDRIGVIYAESSNPQKPLNEVNYDMISGVAPIVAMAVDHVAVIELLRADNTRLKEESDLRHDLVGESSAMMELQKIIGKVAPTNSNVLIHGESGTGKELIART
jgi:transcriptional regulator with GAF, ATPase, and Fis domain